ncbi:dihydrofolate reductase family protein [Streptomyces sp. NPDC002685]|uniref:dihydrofolate reductase family protein n=1 Tax=Streptomyces sp. NPDC002685 TaxID=3154540 RepID=UPI00331E4E17
MRKIVLMMSVSLDGFFEGPNREIDWHRVNAEMLQHFNEEISAFGALLSGRVTHELMAAYWPTADKDPQIGPEMAEFAGIWRNMPKVVFSRTLKHADWHTTVVSEVVPEEIRALKAQAGGDLGLGGADLAAEFLRHDLVDQFRLYVHPVLIGRGRRLFPESEAMTGLRLIETRTFENGVVLLRYERDRAADTTGTTGTTEATETTEAVGTTGTTDTEEA